MFKRIHEFKSSYKIYLLNSYVVRNLNKNEPV